MYAYKSSGTGCKYFNSPSQGGKSHKRVYPCLTIRREKNLLLAWARDWLNFTRSSISIECDCLMCMVGGKMHQNHWSL